MSKKNNDKPNEAVRQTIETVDTEFAIRARIIERIKNETLVYSFPIEKVPNILRDIANDYEREIVDEEEK